MSRHLSCRAYAAMAAVAACGLFPSAHGAEKRVRLCTDGKPDAVIVEPDQATDQEHFAATDLADHLQQMCKAKFPVVAESKAPPDRTLVYVGHTAFARQHGVPLDELGFEEWVVRTVDGQLILAGGRPRGTLFAVFEFLERVLGCRWFDEYTAKVPQRSTVSTGALDLRGKPAFWYRYVYTGEYTIWGQSGGDFRLRNKGSAGTAVAGFQQIGAPQTCHTFYHYSKNWPKDATELFSMNDAGKRERAVASSGPGHICMTNPNGVRLVLKELRRFIKQDRVRAEKAGMPPPRIYDISQNDDNSHLCLCPSCRELAKKEGSDSGPLLHFINAVAAGIRDEYPDILIQTFAYTTTQKPPKTIRPRDNVIIRLCDLGAEWTGVGNAEYFKPLSNPLNSTFCQRIDAWSGIASHLAVWDYWIMYRPSDRFPTPYANVAMLQPDIKLFLKHGTETIFAECENVETTSFFALKRWLGYKLMDRPEQDVNGLIADFMDGYYGSAAPHMTAYLAYLERRIADVPTAMSTIKEQERPYLDGAFFRTVQGLLDSAEAACAPGSLELFHVQRERIPVDAGLYNLWEKLGNALPEGEKMPFEREALLNRYTEYRRAQMQRYRTEKTLAKGIEGLDLEVTRFRERSNLAALSAKPPPRIVVPKCAPPPGGDPALVAWEKALPLGVWRENEGYSTSRTFEAWLAHDGRSLYVRLRDPDCKTDRLVSSDEVWRGDTWELFAAPERGVPPYRQLAVSPKEGLFERVWLEWAPKRRCTPWRSGARAVSTVTDNSWTLDLAVPLAQLTPVGVTPGQPFYMNLYRTTANPGKKVYAWSPNFERGCHALKRLGEVVLGD